MKPHTTFSVVIRLSLWVVMLLGGGWYGLMKDQESDMLLSPGIHLFWVLLGAGVILLAFRAAANGGKELKKGRTQKRTPRLETDTLVTTGIYRCMRHPMLFGLTLLPLGWGLILASPTFVYFIAPVEMLFIIAMVTIFEEWEARQKFPQAYEAYAKEVPMVSFKRACLVMLFAPIKRG